MVVDVTECPIRFEFQEIMYSMKSSRHVLKYKMGVHIDTGLFVWLSGPWPGIMHDLTIIRQSELLDHLEEFEFIMADKAYIGEDKIITLIRNPGTELDEEINRIIYRYRIIVENSFGRLKNFQCMKQEWGQDISFHPLVMRALVNILNVELRFQPLQR